MWLEDSEHSDVVFYFIADKRDPTGEGQWTTDGCICGANCQRSTTCCASGGSIRSWNKQLLDQHARVQLVNRTASGKLF